MKQTWKRVYTQPKLLRCHVVTTLATTKRSVTHMPQTRKW